MSKSARVSKLESLLARIRGRAAEPRPALPEPAPVLASAAPAARPVVAVPVAPPPAPAPPPPVAPSPPVAPAPMRDVSRSEAPVSVQADQVDEATLPPPPMANDDFAVDVDMPATTPPPPPMIAEPLADEAQASEASHSQERLSVAPTPSTEPPAEAPDAGPSIEQGEVLADEEALVGEEPEETPISSRRPVAPPPEERLAELAFGAGEPQPPRHTPPPKSGRLPAPPSDFDADVTGVRDAVAISTHDDEPTQISAPIAKPAVLVPQAARPNLAASAGVADVIGDAQNFAPKTFLDLLDASLSL